MQTTFKTALSGAKVQHVRSQRASGRSINTSVVAMASNKKVNSYDDEWEKGFFGTGLFLEDRETSSKSAYKKIEEKKLLSTVEKLGLLSKLEQGGLTLTKIEESGLLSTAERLGLLSVAEDLLTANPATIASGSLPFVVLAIAAAALIPHDSGITSAISYTLAATFAGVGGAIFVLGGFVLPALQED